MFNAVESLRGYILMLALCFAPNAMAKLSACDFEASYHLQQCMTKSSANSSSWLQRAQAMANCKNEVVTIKKACEARYYYEQGSSKNAIEDLDPTKKTGTSLGKIPSGDATTDENVILPSSAEVGDGKSRNEETCSFGEIIKRIHERTKITNEMLGNRYLYFITLKKLDYSETVIAVNELKQNTSTLKINTASLRQSFGGTQTLVKNFNGAIGGGTSSMKMDQLKGIDGGVRKSASSSFMSIENARLSLHAFAKSVQKLIRDLLNMIEGKAKVSRYTSQTLNENTKKTIELTNNADYEITNSRESLVHSAIINPNQVSKTHTEELVQNIHLTTMISSKAITLTCTPSHHIPSTSYEMSVGGDSLYLAEEVKLRSDFSSNIKDFNECAALNDLDNIGDIQKSHLLRNLVLSMQASILAARLTEAREHLMEMDIWNQRLTEMDKEIQESVIDAADAIVAAFELLDEIAKLKLEFTKNWISMASDFKSQAELCVDYLSQTPPILAPGCPTTLPPAQAALSQATTSYSEAIAANGLAITEEKEAKQDLSEAKQEQKDLQTLGQVTCEEPEVTFKTSPYKYFVKVFFKYLSFIAEAHAALASPQELLDQALGVKENSRYRTFYDEAKDIHISIMTGNDSSYPQYSMEELDKRVNYMGFSTQLGVSSYNDMANRTYTSLMENSDKNAEVLAALGSDTLGGFASDLQTAYKQVLSDVVNEVPSKAIDISIESFDKLFSSDSAKKLRDFRKKEIEEIEKKIGKSQTSKLIQDDNTYYLPSKNKGEWGEVVKSLNDRIIKTIEDSKKAFSTDEYNFLRSVKKHTTSKNLSKIGFEGIHDKNLDKLKNKKSIVKDVKIKDVKINIKNLKNYNTNFKVTKSSNQKAEVNGSKSLKDQSVYYIEGHNIEEEKLPFKRTKRTLWTIISNAYLRAAYPIFLDKKNSLEE